MAERAPAAETGPFSTSVVPAGTAFSFRLDSSLSSHGSKKYQRFSFTTSTDIVAGGSVVVAAGARGSGVVLLAGPAGNEGHEGDLTLRLDSVTAVRGRHLVFANQRISIDGRNRKIVSGAMGFVPVVGLGSFFIPGKNIVVGTSIVIRTVLTHAGSLRND